MSVSADTSKQMHCMVFFVVVSATLNFSLSDVSALKAMIQTDCRERCHLLCLDPGGRHQKQRVGEGQAE